MVKYIFYLPLYLGGAICHFFVMSVMVVTFLGLLFFFNAYLISQNINIKNKVKSEIDHDLFQ